MLATQIRLISIIIKTSLNITMHLFYLILTAGLHIGGDFFVGVLIVEGF